jgi:hypothetical protein
MMRSLAIMYHDVVENGDFASSGFPGEGAHDFTVYAHMGQHSSGTRGWYNRTRAATPAEYASLLAEIKRIYERGQDPVRLQIVERFTKHHDSERRKNAQGSR